MNKHALLVLGSGSMARDNVEISRDWDQCVCSLPRFCYVKLRETDVQLSMLTSFFDVGWEVLDVFMRSVTCAAM